MKKLILVMLCMMASTTAIAEIYYPNEKVVNEENVQKSCNQSATSYELFDELLKFYKSVDNEMPGVTPEKSTYFMEEMATKNLKRIAEVSKDPLFSVYNTRHRIKNLTFHLTLARESYKLPVKRKMELIIDAIARTDRVGQDFEYMYQTIDMGNVPKGTISGILTSMTSNDTIYVLNNYMSCLLSKI
jgi:hypothetical protein